MGVAIGNQKEFEAWLKEQPQEVWVQIGARVAARVFPIAARSAYSNTKCVLMTGRAILTALLSLQLPPSKAKSAAIAAGACVIGNSDTADAVRAAAGAAALADHARIPNIELYFEDILRDAGDVAGSILYRATRADMALFAHGLLDMPLWPEKAEPKGLLKSPDEGNSFWEADAAWAFWRRWYHGMLVGKPLDWELQRRVALIENDIWEAGPQAVAAEIARIEAAYEVEKRASELEAKAQTAVQASRGIGDNNPPSPIEDAIKTSDGVTIIWAAAQELKEEAQIETPNKDRVKKAAGVLVGVLKACGLWAGKKLDKGLDAAITSAGKEIGKRLVQALSATVIARITGLDDLIFGLIEAVQRWLPFITG